MLACIETACNKLFRIVGIILNLSYFKIATRGVFNKHTISNSKIKIKRQIGLLYQKNLFGALFVFD